MKKAIIVAPIAFLFIILFLYTGISKILEYPVAKEQIALSPLFAPVAGAVILFTITAEIITSILLFFPRTRNLGLWSSLALLLAFTGYIIYLLNYNELLPCTCGGVLEQLSWPQHLILNAVLAALAITSLVLSRQPSKSTIARHHPQPQP